MRDKILSLVDSVKELQKDLQFLSQRHAGVLKTIREGTKEVKDLKSVSNILFNLIEVSHKSSLDSLSSFVNKSLKATFGDDYEFYASADFKRRKSVINFELSKYGVKRSLESYGGGVVTFLSLIFRVFIIEVCNLRRLLFLDEALSQTSINFRVKVYQFLKLLSDKGYIIMMIMHDSEGIEEFTSKNFLVSQEEGITSVKEVESYE